MNTKWLKEDGSLDIERINNLPFEEYMDAIGELTEEQFNEYRSKLPVNESKEPMRAIRVNFSIENKGVPAELVIEDLKRKYQKRNDI